MPNPVDKEILRIALPAIVSNITVPLLGLADVAIAGHLGDASYIGAIAVGGMLFNMIYWMFSFLRMGTGGLAAQAYGQGNLAESMRVLLRSLAVAVAMAALLLILQHPIRWTAFTFIDASPEVREMATLYFHICIWGAPAILASYSLTGWFIGMQNSRIPMYVAIVQNVVNIAASLFFVFVLGMKVAGVALGTLIAQYAGLLTACIFWQRRYGLLREHARQTRLFEHAAMKRFFSINRDIFVRTACIVAVTVFFTSTGAAHGNIILAVNTLLMQLFTLFSYIMDGFAYAGEALSGRYIGAADRPRFRSTVRHLFAWGAGAAAAFTLLYAAGGEGFLQLLTNDTAVIRASQEYFLWVLAIPFAGFSAFLLDGICIGATATRIMLCAVAAATAAFFLLYHSLQTAWGNHALWMAFLSYLFLRGIVQAGLAMSSYRRGRFCPKK